MPAFAPPAFAPPASARRALSGLAAAATPPEFVENGAIEPFNAERRAARPEFVENGAIEAFNPERRAENPAARLCSAPAPGRPTPGRRGTAPSAARAAIRAARRGFHLLRLDVLGNRHAWRLQ